MLHRLSKAVAELYALAENTEPDQFREELLALLHTLIRFDGAVLESGDINLTLRPADDAPQETATQRIAALLRKTDHDRYLASTAACIGRLSAPYACDKSRLSQHELPWLRDLGTAPGFRKLLLFGDLPASRPWPRWLLLYRDGERDFSDEDANLLHNLGRDLANSRDWPDWGADSEFRAIRDKSAAERPGASTPAPAAPAEAPRKGERG